MTVSTIALILLAVLTVAFLVSGHTPWLRLDDIWVLRRLAAMRTPC